jgi:hypothetical protein
MGRHTIQINLSRRMCMGVSSVDGGWVVASEDCS